MLLLVEHLSQGHKFMQDIDTKHTSRATESLFEVSCVNWWKTPDLNPIENLGHKLKEFLHREAKPQNKQEVVFTLMKMIGQKDWWFP